MTSRTTPTRVNISFMDVSSWIFKGATGEVRFSRPVYRLPPAPGKGPARVAKSRQPALCWASQEPIGENNEQGHRQQAAKPLRARRRRRGGVCQLPPRALERHHHPHRDAAELAGGWHRL